MKAFGALAASVAALIVLLPFVASAIDFGGDSSLVIPCANGGSRYDDLSGPVGGAYLWTPATETFSFGPPSHPGQWLLGIAGPLGLCLVTIDPIFTLPATIILMMGSSQ